jgi:DNA-binding IclR family transcriptional regulator
MTGVDRKSSPTIELWRAMGIANSLGARRSSLNALSVPIFDRDEQVVVAVTSLGMAPRFDADLAVPLALRMQALSDQLPAQMGCPMRRK